MALKRRLVFVCRTVTFFILFFALFLFLKPSNTWAIQCQISVSNPAYACLDAQDPSVLNGTCTGPSGAGSAYDCSSVGLSSCQGPGNSGKYCYLCPNTTVKTWTCSDNCSGSTYQTAGCGSSMNQCTVDSYSYCDSRCGGCPTPPPANTCPYSCLSASICTSLNDLQVVSGYSCSSGVCCTSIAGPTPTSPPTCNPSQCPYYCGDAQCNLYQPACVGASCGAGAKIGYSASCNQLWDSVSCPLKCATNLTAAQDCSVISTPKEVMYWSKGYDSYINISTNLYYCDQTFATKWGVTCTSGSAPPGTTDNTKPNYRAGWYLMWQQTTTNSPQSLPTTTNPWPAGATGTTPLTIGDTYRWYIHSSGKDGNGVNHACDAQGADFTANACVCTAPNIPTNLKPNGTIINNTCVASINQNVTWDSVNGADHYALRIDDQTANGWTGTCTSVNPNDVCLDNVTSTSFSYNFIPGHKYHIWVHAISGCGGWSTQTDAYVNANTCIQGQAYIDNNNDAYFDTNDVGKANATVSNGVNPSVSTASDGTYSIPNVAPGNYTMSISNYGSGLSISYPNPYPPSISVYSTNYVQNFALRPQAPTCAGNPPITQSANNIFQGTLTPINLACNNPTVPSGQTPVYLWGLTTNPITLTAPATPGKVANTNASTSTYTAPANSRPSPFTAQPLVYICDPGGIICTGYQTSITVNPLFTINGNVYIDNNKDNIKDNGESNYLGGINNEITLWNSTGTTQIVTYPITFGSSGLDGTYKIDNIPAGSYQVKYALTTAGSQGYIATYPRPPTYAVNVGPCRVGGSTAIPPCDISIDGDINPLNLGITNSSKWIQTVGGDIYFRNLSEIIPLSATTNVPYGTSNGGPYASVFGTGNTPGVVYSGDVAAYFGPTGANASANPYNWNVGNTTYPNLFKSNNQPLSTSYSNVNALINQYGKSSSVQQLSVACGGNITNCNISAAASGIYNNTTAGTVTLNTSNVAANTRLIILVNGDLNINGPIHVPLGSTLFITVSGNITVSPAVGEALPATYCKAPQGANPSSGCDIEGYYSTDHSFTLNGNGGSCPTGDLRLNLGGSLVVNALNPSNSGAGIISYSNRDLCANGSLYPVFSVTERPDFILNSPDLFKTQRRIWQEVNP